MAGVQESTNVKSSILVSQTDKSLDLILAYAVSVLLRTTASTEDLLLDQSTLLITYAA